MKIIILLNISFHNQSFARTASSTAILSNNRFLQPLFSFFSILLLAWYKIMGNKPKKTRQKILLKINIRSKQDLRIMGSNTILQTRVQKSFILNLLMIKTKNGWEIAETGSVFMPWCINVFKLHCTVGAVMNLATCGSGKKYKICCGRS